MNATNPPSDESSEAPTDGVASPSAPAPVPFQGTDKELISSIQGLAEAIGITAVREEAWPQLAQYCRLVWGWNEKMNLTRHTTPELFVKRDLLDSVELGKCIRPNEEVLDIGTGGGVPGILIAILRPDVEVTLCDSVAKKAKAAQEIVEGLGLNVPVHSISVTKVLEDFRYDTLFARAVGPLGRLCGWLREDWHKFGRLLAIKGPRWPDERGEARHRGLLKGVDLRRLVSYRMPDTQSESTILQLSRQLGPQPIDET